jgi:hypothetical protein
MGLDDMVDPHTGGGRVIEILLHVPAGIDDRGDTGDLVGDEV